MFIFCLFKMHLRLPNIHNHRIQFTVISWSWLSSFGEKPLIKIRTCLHKIFIPSMRFPVMWKGNFLSAYRSPDFADTVYFLLCSIRHRFYLLCYQWQKRTASLWQAKAASPLVQPTNRISIHTNQSIWCIPLLVISDIMYTDIN